MKRNTKKRQNTSDSPSPQKGSSQSEPSRVSQRGRRNLLDLLRAGLGVVVASTGAAALFQQSSGTALARPLDNVGSFSTSDPGVAAVTAIATASSTAIRVESYTQGGLNHGFGVLAITDAGIVFVADSTSGTCFSASTGSGDGADLSSSSGYGAYCSSDSGYGVAAVSNSSLGIYGSSTSEIGIYGSSESDLGGLFYSQDSAGLYAYSSNSTGLLVYGPSNAAALYGDVAVYGTLSKGGGSFLIDHPLDPANKSLYHSFVESPDMKNIYDGVVQLDRIGEATVTLPAWFEALNSDFRYQLTALGAAAPNLHIAQEVQNNQFKIAGGTPGMKISWQVTGIRQDAWARANRIPVEENKPASQKGRYHYPEVFGAAREKGIGYHAYTPPQAPARPSSPTKSS